MLTHLIIINPKAGRGRGRKLRQRVERHLDLAGLAYEVHVTDGPGDAREVTRREAGRYGVIVAMGGDGTIQEVAGGLAEARLAASHDAHEDLAVLGILPAGTGNDLIKSLRLPADFEDACDRLRTGRRRPLDLGRIRWRSADDAMERERIFVNNVGLGFEGQVGWEAYHLKVPLRGMPLYLLALLRVLGRLVNPPLRIQFDGAAMPVEEKLLVSIGNGHTSGGGFRLNPAANPFDGKLDCCVIRARGRLEVLRFLPKVLKGGHVGLPGVDNRRAERVDLTGERPFHGHADGELLGERILGAHVEILPGLLPVIC